MMQCEVCHIQQLNMPEMILYENENWTVVLRDDDQEYLGKSVVSLKGHTATISQLSDQQWLAFADASRWLEQHIMAAFQPTHFNWQCLMNLGAAEGVTHVHWHCTPRYREPVVLADETFVDQRWPKSCRSVLRRPVEPKLAIQIANKIKE